MVLDNSNLHRLLGRLIQRNFDCSGLSSHLDMGVSRPPDPGPTWLADPNRSPGRDTIYTIYCILYCTGTLIDLFFLRAVPVPMGI